MASWNGPAQNGGRIEFDYTVGSVSQNTTSVTVAVTAYLRMLNNNRSVGSWPQSWSGSWGSGSSTPYYDIPRNGRVEIRSWSGTVSLTGAPQSRSFQISAQHAFGTTGATLNVTIPARFAQTPTDLTAERLSDSSVRLQWSRIGTYTSVGVQFRHNTGSGWAAWTGAGTATGNAFTFTKTSGLYANRAYQFRVQGRGGSGASAWSPASDVIYMTPAAPSSVSAVRTSAGIRVDVSGLPPHGTHFDVWDEASGTVVGSNVPRSALPWTHVGPDPSVPHRYRVRSRQSSGGVGSSVLVSGWSAWSNTVQLQAAPNAPTGLVPNGGVVAAGVSERFAWSHNPSDSSEQTAYELRHRPVGGGWTTLSGTAAQFRDVSLPAGVREWQVRTKGAHADWSPWSATATVTAITVPTVAISVPGPVWTVPNLTVSWAFDQLQGRPQTGWRVELSSGGDVLVDQSGTGAQSSFLLPVRLTGDTGYRLRVWVANSGVWSDYDELSFSTVFTPPAEPLVDAVWNEGQGSHDLTIDGSVGPVRADIVNLVPNPRMASVSGTVEVRRNLSTNPSFEAGLSGTLATVGSAYLTREQRETRFGSWVAAADVDWGAFSYIYQRYNVSPGADDWWLAFKVHHLESDRTPTAVRAAYRIGADGEWVYSSLSDREYRALGDPGTAQVAMLVSAAATEFMVIVYGSQGETQTENRVMYTDAWSIGRGASDAAALEQVREYFDGDTELDPAEGLTARWLGTPHESGSLLEGQRVADVGDPTAGRALPAYRVPDGRGGYAARFQIIESAGSDLPISNLNTVPGTTYTGLVEARASKNVSGALRLRVGGTYPEGSDIFTEWSEFAHTAVAVSSGVAGTGLTTYSNSFELGDYIDITHSLLTEGEYNGPYFDGGTGQVRVDGSAMNASWDGPVDASTSRLSMAESTVRVEIERSLDEGQTWTPVDALDYADGDTISISDFEGRSHGETWYRVTGFSTADEAAETLTVVVSDSGAIWVGGGEGGADTVRLPAQPRISITSGRERSTVPYWGAARPVAYTSPRLIREVGFSGRVTDEPVPGINLGLRDDLERVVHDPYPVHVYRDYRGHVIHGSLALLGTTDIGTRNDKQGGGVWDYSLNLTETRQ